MVGAVLSIQQKEQMVIYTFCYVLFYDFWDVILLIFVHQRVGEFEGADPPDDRRLEMSLLEISGRNVAL